MATVRTQYGIPSALADVTNTGVTVFEVLRPRTTPVERNTIDHVARPYRRQEFEGGLAVMELTANLATNDHAVRVVEILDWDGNVARTVLSTALNSYVGDLDVTAGLLSRLTISEDEAGVRVAVIKLTGGTTANGGVFGRFDFGLNNANYGSNQGL